MPPSGAEPHPAIAVAILAKAPVAGFAKTRLIPRLGAAGAAALQAWLLRRTVATAVAAELGPVSLWCAPDIDHPDFAACRAFGELTLRRQPAGDLGARMHAAVDESAGVGGTLVIGTDCPLLTPEGLRQAAGQLRDHDATVVPAEDGGYVLIGLRRVGRRVFQQVDWGSERVMVQTRAQLRAMNWRWSELAPLWDVDRDEDVGRLLRLFPEAGAATCDA